MKPAVFSSVSSYISRHVARPRPKPAIGIERIQECALLCAAMGRLFRPAGERGRRRVAVVCRDPCRRCAGCCAGGGPTCCRSSMRRKTRPGSACCCWRSPSRCRRRRSGPKPEPYWRSVCCWRRFVCSAGSRPPRSRSPPRSTCCVSASTPKTICWRASTSPRYACWCACSTTIIVLITAGFALMTFDAVRQYGVSLFASAGVAGIIAGLAAQPVLSNLFAGVQLAVTQPIRLEDAVTVENEYGWIEEITSTYVVIRLWDLRRLIVPLTYFIEQPFYNWTRHAANTSAMCCFTSTMALRSIASGRRPASWLRNRSRQRQSHQRPGDQYAAGRDRSAHSDQRRFGRRPHPICAPTCAKN